MQKLPMSNEQLLRTILGVLGLIAAVAVTVSAAQHLSLIHISEPTRLHKVSRMPSSA